MGRVKQQQNEAQAISEGKEKQEAEAISTLSLIPLTVARGRKLVEDAINGIMTGSAWVKQGAAVLIDIGAKIKEVKAEKESKTRKDRDALRKLDAPFNKQIKSLEDMDKELRRTLLEQYVGGKPIQVEGGGEIIFKQPWTWEVEINPDTGLPNHDAIPAAFLKVVVDGVKVQEAIEAGSRRIPGLRIYQDRQPVVYVTKGGEE